MYELTINQSYIHNVTRNASRTISSGTWNTKQFLTSVERPVIGPHVVLFVLPPDSLSAQDFKREKERMRECTISRHAHHGHTKSSLINGWKFLSETINLQNRCTEYSEIKFTTVNQHGMAAGFFLSGVRDIDQNAFRQLFYKRRFKNKSILNAKWTFIVICIVSSIGKKVNVLKFGQELDFPSKFDK